MILTDELSIVRSAELLNSGAVPPESGITWELPIPAQVRFRTQDGFLEADEPGRRWAERAVLTAMIAPLNMAEPLDRRRHAVRWRGTLYAITGSPLITRRGKRDHHWTIELYRGQG